MAKGDKPLVKVYGKRMNKAPEDAPEYVDLAAFWMNDGKLGGMWSRDIIAIKVRDRAGKVHVIDPAVYFCNLRDDREPAMANRIGVTRAGHAADKRAAKANNDPPPDFGEPDFGDDDIPF